MYSTALPFEIFLRITSMDYWHVEQLYTDPALMLDASTRVAAAAGSGLMVAFVNT